LPPIVLASQQRSGYPASSGHTVHQSFALGVHQPPPSISCATKGICCAQAVTNQSRDPYILCSAETRKKQQMVRRIKPKHSKDLKAGSMATLLFICISCCVTMGQGLDTKMQSTMRWCVWVRRGGGVVCFVATLATILKRRHSSPHFPYIANHPLSYVAC